MTSVLHKLRALAATAVVAALFQLGSLVASPVADANNQVATATASVNVRTGPSTKYSRLGTLPRGASIEQIGRSGVWSVVRYNGRTAYIHGSYLTTRTSSAPQVATGGATGTYYSTARLNVRTAASLSSGVVTTVNKDTAFSLTGRTANGFSEATVNGVSRWLWTAYLRPGAASNAPAVTPPAKPTAPAPVVNPPKQVVTTALPAVTGQMRLTGTLIIRADDSANPVVLGKLPIGSIIDVTGVRRNGVVQAVYQGAVRWFDANWVTAVSAAQPAPVTPSAPGAIGTRYSKDDLNVRAQASQSSTLLGRAPKGTTFQVTGKISNGYAEIIWQGRSAWVAAQYLIATQGSLITAWSSGLDSLLPAGKGVVAAVRQNFPQISVMYGVRFDPIPDHPSGKAVDIMLPDYKNNRALGQQIANYMQANAKRLNIRYIIFAQRVWNIERASEGWRMMADRGSDNDNHYNHIHVTTY